MGVSPAASQLVSSRDFLLELHSASKDVGSSKSCRRRPGQAGCQSWKCLQHPPHGKHCTEERFLCELSLLCPRERLSLSSEPLLTSSLKMVCPKSSTLSRSRTGPPSSSWRLLSPLERTPSEPLPWTVPRVSSVARLSMTPETPS